MKHKKAFIYRPQQHEGREDQFIEDLRGLMWKRGAFGAKNHTWGKLGELSNLAPTTVQRFAQGDTKRPTAHTLLRLLHATGYELKPVRIAGAKR